MPSLSWKKAKAKAISKFVVDRLQSSKHGGAGGSLVVETGFPTSVVDLFVKNRDRLKKPPSSSSSSIKKISKSSSKNPTLDLIPVPIHPSPSASAAAAASGGGNPPSTQTPTPLLFSPPDSGTPANFLLPPPPPHAPTTTLVQQLQQGDDVCQGDCDSTMLFMAMLKMFFVVLLAFATSKFVVGITLSAFLLLFMEYAGKHLCRLFLSSFKSKPKPDDDDDDESSPPPPPPLQCMCMINKSLSSLSFYKPLQCFMTSLGINKRNRFSHQHANGEDEEEEDFKAPPPSTTPELTTTTTREYNNNNAFGGHFHEIGISAPTSTNLVPRPPRRRRIPCVASEPDLLNWANREQQQQQQAQEEEEEDGRNDEVLDKEAAAYTSCNDFSESCLELKKRTSRRYKIKSKIKRLVSGNLKNKKRINESSGGGNKAPSLFSSTSLDEDTLNTSMMSCSGSSGRRMELVKFKQQQFGTQGDDDRSMSSSTADNGICLSNELSRADTEDGTTAATSSTSSVILLREEEEDDEKPTASKTERRNSSSGYLIFFAMVLVGLVGGRALAIAFTLSWCLLLKSCGILKPRTTKCVAAADDDDASSSSISS